MRVRKLAEKDYAAVEAIARGLRHRPGGGGWFSPEACERTIPLDIRTQRGFVAEESGRVFGFITYTSYDCSVRISWMGVTPDRRRTGIGRLLLGRLESELRGMGWTEVLVETPTEEEGRGTDYEGTYRFYTCMGFKVRRIRRLGEPHFESDCDIAVLGKVLG